MLSGDGLCWKTPAVEKVSIDTLCKSSQLLGATIVGRSSGHRETPSIAIVLYDCHVSIAGQIDVDLIIIWRN